MSLQITDTFTDLEDNPLAYYFGWVAPMDAFMEDVSGTWKEVGTDPAPIGTDASGVLTLTLPWPSVCSTPAPIFQLRDPLGNTYQGIVPEGIAGPLSIHDLLQPPYNWQRVS